MLTLTTDLKTASGLPSSKIKAILDDAASEFDRIAKDAPDNPKLLAQSRRLDVTYAETFQAIGQTSDALARAGEAREIASKLAANIRTTRTMPVSNSGGQSACADRGPANGGAGVGRGGTDGGGEEPEFTRL